MDSPRGRIYLMKQRIEGEPLDDAMVRHFDQCLGCMACVTACPSGVQYDRLIEATRAQVEQEHERSPRDRAQRGLVFRMFPYPRRLRAMRPLLRAYQRSGAARVARRSGVLDRLAAPLAAVGRPAPSRARGRDGQVRLPPTMGAVQRLAPAVPRERERMAETTRAVSRRRARVGMLLG